MELLLSQPTIRLNELDSSGFLAVHRAAWEGHTAVVQAMLQREFYAPGAG